MNKNLILHVFLLLVILTPASLRSNVGLLWSFETGGGVVGEPVILNDSLFIGSLDGNFYALDALTGEELWHFASGNQIRTTAAIYEGIICFESGNVLYGLTKGGSLIWTDTLYDGELINAHDQWDVFRSSPTIRDTIAYIGSEEGLVLGVHVKTGNRVFEAQTPQADATIETTPAIYNNKVYVGDWLGVFSVFDLTTGELVWQHDTKEDDSWGWSNAIISKPLIYKDTLYFGGKSCNLYAFNPETGDNIWRYDSPTDQWLFGGPVVDHDILYVGSSYQQEVYAFRTDEPELLWATNVHGLNYGNPVITEDYVIVGAGNTGGNTAGALAVVDKNSHELVQRFNIDGWVETPLYREGVVYFGCSSGMICAVKLNDLVSMLRPETFLKDNSEIQLGTFAPEGTTSTSFYIYNTGEGNDSIADISSFSRIDVQPSNFILESNDSVEITVTIDLEDLSSGSKSYIVQLRSLNSMVPVSFSRKISLMIEEADALSETSTDAPFNIRLYPNPASINAKLEFYLEKPSFVQAILYNELGIKVRTLYQGYRPEGKNSLEFDTSSLESGQYFYMLLIVDTLVEGRMLIMEPK